jgi:hypothetical protein
LHPNLILKFKVFTLGYLLYTLPLLLNILAWRDKLLLYSKNLSPLIKGILTYSIWIRVTTLLLVYIYLNQLPSNADLGVIIIKIASNLPIGYIVICLLKVIYYFPLGLIPKLNRTFYCIYNLFSLKSCWGLFINTVILEVYFTLTYSIIDDILVLILFVKRGAIILKYNLKDAF